ncbi:MAG: flagellin [Lachnospiraceae bacterium]|nr:flagellin [Lachnospiraceae bacterium]
MVVQHNLTAMNSNRMLGITTGSQAKSTEKLSSGYKINRAADDAAGLAISEKMRKQMRGLTQASSNAQDGISAVQTAEGALTEVHDMLQRMNELAVKAANGTNSESDRKAIQDEVDQLVTEIDRVSTTTKFNETYLLKGTNATTGNTGELTYTTANGNVSGAPFNTETGIAEKSVPSAATASTTGDTGSVTKYNTKDIEFGGKTYKLISDIAANSSDDTALSTDKVLANLTSSDGTTKAFTNLENLMSAIRKDFGADVKNVSSETDKTGKQTIKIEAFANVNNAADLSLHVGADSSTDNKISMNIANLSARGLEINGLRVDGDTGVNATNAIDKIASALQKVSDQRASLGAIQNRLEHTIANLDNVVENTTSAESAIRDTDMATEMVKYSNNNILAQAGQAMLAQANQSNQGVLSLLQ